MLDGGYGDGNGAVSASMARQDRICDRQPKLWIDSTKPQPRAAIVYPSATRAFVLSSVDGIKAGRQMAKVVHLRPYLAVFAMALLCYVYFLPRWADWNQSSRFDLVVALVDDHTFQIDKYVANTGDYALYDGHHFSDKAPGMALLGLPIYAAFRHLVAPALM